MPPGNRNRSRRRTIRHPYRGQGPADNRPANKPIEVEVEETIDSETRYDFSQPADSGQTNYDEGKPAWQQGLDGGGTQPKEEAEPNDEGTDNQRVPFNPAERQNTTDGEGDDKSLSDDQLKEREANGGEAAGGQTDKAASQEGSKLPGQDGADKKDDDLNYNPDDDKKHPRRLGTVRRLLKRRGALVAAGAVSGLLVIIAGFFGSMEAVHIRENLLGPGNKLVNNVLDNRRGKNLAYTLKKLNTGDFRQRLDVDKFAEKFRAQGFRVDIDDTGKLKEFGFTNPATGEYRALDLADPDYRRSARSFFGRDAGDFGRQASIAFDEVSGLRASTWKGKAARRLYAKMKVTLRDWTNPREFTATDPDDPKKTAGQAYNQADQKDTATLSENRSNAADTNNNGEVDADEEGRDVTSDPADELPEETADARDAATKGENVDARLGIDPDIVEAATSGVEDMANAGAAGGILDSLRSSLTTRFPKLSSIASRMTTAITITEVPRIACKIKGTLNFAADVRNVYLAAELAVFAVRFLTVADHQKEGLITSTGMRMFMTYMHTPSPITGETYLSDGGLQNIAFGDTEARPSSANMAKFATGRAHQGVLATIMGIINSIPFTGDGSCQTVNNGLVQLGGAIVGVVAGFLSGGSITVGNMALAVGLGVVEEVAFAIVTPMIVKSMIGAVMTGYESGPAIGGMLASGFGSLRGSSASVNGLRIGNRAQAALIEAQANESLAYARSQQSIFERYFDPYTSDSLVTRMAFAMPRQPLAAATSIFTNLGQTLSPSSLLKRLPFVTASAQEAEEDPCLADPQIRDLNIPTDVYCNPIPLDAPDLDLSITEQVLRGHQATRLRKVDDVCITETVPAPLIDEEGRAIPYQDVTPGALPECNGTIYMNDDLQDYINYCHSGRPALLYDISDTEKIKQGSSTAPKASMLLHDPYEEFEDPCVSNPRDVPLANDVEGIGRFTRYTAWYAAKYVDEDNFVEDMNEDYSGDGSQSSSTPAAIISGDTTSISCQAGTDAGIVDGYRQGSLVKIRICNVQGITVNSQISHNINQLLNAAKAEGFTFTGFGFRDMATQERLYAENCPNGRCTVDTARPGRSNHQMGLAIDFGQNGRSICFPYDAATCDRSGNQAFLWLVKNASKYGLENYPAEAWHWSVGGD